MLRARNVMIVLLLLLMSMVSVASAQTLSITQIDPSEFPDEIDTFVRLVDAGGQVISGKVKRDFTVTENGVPVPRYDVIPANESGESVNWALVIDNSGSMIGDRLNATKLAAHAFIDDMRPGDRASIVRFSDRAEVLQGLTQYKALLHRAVNNLTANGVTALYDGCYLGLQQLATATRPRAVIILSDGNDSGVSRRTLAEVIGIAGQDSLGIPCYTIGLVVPDPAPLQTIATSTQAEYINVANPTLLPDIYLRISQSIRSQYQVTFASPNRNFDGTTRTVRITYNHAPFPFDEVQYVVDQAPRIVRTPATITLSNSIQQAGTPFTISAEITDNVRVAGAFLYYRTTPAPGINTPYSDPRGMQAGAANIYSAVIPSEISLPFGSTAYAVDYYLEATDGRLTSQSPRLGPQSFPWQIPIFPNQYPILTHTPVEKSGVGLPVPIRCVARDTTNIIEGVSLFYRRGDNIFYVEIEMTHLGNNEWLGTIPGSEMTTTGIDYWIVANDNYGLRAFSPADRSFWHILPGGEPGPINLTADSGNNGNVPLRWTAPTAHRVLSYNVYRSTSATGNFIKIAGNVMTTNYTDETAINDVTYWYYVTALYEAPDGESLPSNIAEATPGIRGDVIVIIPNVRGIPGDSVVVQINVNNSRNVAGGSFTISYCPSFLTPTSVRRGGLLANAFFDSRIETVNNAVRFSFSQSGALSGAAGTLAEITFRVSADAVLGSTCTITAPRAEMYNIDGNALRVGVQTGIVSLGSKGDVNGDGRINSADAILTLRLAVDDPNYRPLDRAYQLWAAEVDGTDTGNDRLPDAFDATLILRVDVGYMVVIPKEPRLKVGQQQQFLVLGGQPPYEWSFSQAGVGVITSTGLMTATGPGIVQVRAKDAQNRTDATRNISVTVTRADDAVPRPEPVEGQQAEPAYYRLEAERVNGQTVITVYLSAAQRVTSGLFELRYDPAHTLNDLEAGELLAGSLFRANVAESGVIRAAFAGPTAANIATGAALKLYFKEDVTAAALDIRNLSLTDESGAIIPALPDEALDTQPDETDGLPTFLAANYPNPFGGQTTVRFGIASRQHVELAVYNLAGQKVKTLVSQPLDAGSHSLTWDGRDEAGQTVASGVYLYQLKTNREALTRRLVLMR